jgi:glycosyltransferase involved in cell wall biosynthesis
MCLVSVVMSVFNEEEYLADAIESILSQTFTNFEFIIVNDGSTDESINIIKAFDDQRIIIIEQNNKGLTASLNIGIKASKGKYIARQDADDYSYPNRLECQIREFENNSTLVLLGTRADIDYGDFSYISQAYGSGDIKDELLGSNILVHSSVCFLRDKFLEIGLYDIKYDTSQDYDAWLRLSKFGDIAVLNKVLVRRVVRQNSISGRKMIRQCLNTYKIRRDYVSFYRNVKQTVYQYLSNSLSRSMIKRVKIMNRKFMLKGKFNEE